MADRAAMLVSDARFNTPSPNPTHLSLSGKDRIASTDATGYVTPVFEGKEKQMDEGLSPKSCPLLQCPEADLVPVMDALEAKGFIPAELIESEVQWFYTALGIDGECPSWL